MSMIPCDRECTNQQEGYCTMEGITYLPEDALVTEAGCLYFVARENTRKQKEKKLPPIL